MKLARVLLLALAACGHTSSPKTAPALRLAPPPAAADESFREHPPEIGPAEPYFPPEIRESRLPNGVRLLVAPVPIGAVGLRVVMKGSASLPMYAPGMVHVMVNALGISTKALDGTALRKTFEAALAIWGIGGNSDATIVSMRALPSKKEKLMSCIDAIADIVEQPNLDKDTLEFVVPPLGESARTWIDNRSLLARIVAARELYGESHPFAKVDVEGLERDPKVDDKTIVRIYEAIAQPSATTVILTGPVDDTIVAQVKKDFGSWKVSARKPASPVAEPQPKAHARLVVVDRPSSAQSHVVFAALGPARNAADWPALAMLNEILGAHPASRIPRDLFETGALTSGGTRLYLHLPVTFFTFEGTAPTQRTAEVLRAVDGAFEDARTNEPSYDELEREKSSYLRELLGAFADTEQTLDAYTRIPELDLPIDVYAKLFGAIHSVDPADVRKLAAGRLARERLVVVVVGDWKSLRSSLESLGWGAIDVRDATGKRASP